LELVISKASCEEQALSLEEMDALLEKMGEEFKNIPKISMSHILIPMVVEQTSRGERAYDISSRLLKERIIF